LAEAHACADINAAQEVQALISEGQNAHSETHGNRTFFWLLFFVQEKKRDSRIKRETAISRKA
jgi:hypothetical protein